MRTGVRVRSMRQHFGRSGTTRPPGVAREWTKAAPNQINQTSTYDRGKVKLRRIPLGESAAEGWIRQS